ncbi:MAG: hypothetical protein Q9159_006042, partial [Coniocarpon cinnabarinum]
EPDLRVAVITGEGSKAFCAGQDLIEQQEIQIKLARGEALDERLLQHPRSGFMGVSRREGKKPIVAAVNGYAMGGGFEICLGCDMLIASPTARFGLPEAQRGLYAAAGGLSRLVRIVGLPLASEIALAGRVLTAPEAERFQVINRVSKSPESCVDEALALAGQLAQCSPDAVIVTRHGLRQALENGSVERASQVTHERYGEALRTGENLRRGLAAFAMKRKPEWVPSNMEPRGHANADTPILDGIPKKDL